MTEFTKIKAKVTGPLHVACDFSHVIQLTF